MAIETSYCPQSPDTLEAVVLILDKRNTVSFQLYSFVACFLIKSALSKNIICIIMI